MTIHFVSAEPQGRLVADRDPLSHITYFERDDVLVVCVTGAGADHVGREHIIERPQRSSLTDRRRARLEGSTSKAPTARAPRSRCTATRVLGCGRGDCQATRRARRAARRPARAGRRPSAPVRSPLCARRRGGPARPRDPGAVATAGPRSCPRCGRLGARVEDYRRRTADARAKDHDRARCHRWEGRARRVRTGRP